MTINAKTNTEYNTKMGSYTNNRHPLPGTDADIVIGGKDISTGSKLIPQIYAEKHGGESWISYNDKSQIVTDEVPTFEAGKITQTIGEKRNCWYVRDDGTLEWEIWYNKKPASNIFNLEIKCSDNLQFLYQDSLKNQYADMVTVMNANKVKIPWTLAEYLSWNYRPENVEGSYAVYCDKKHGIYQTGKVGHIYRPYIIDADGKKTWCTLEIFEFTNPKIVKITIPQDVLDNAVYPICLGPNFGNDVEGASAGGLTNYHDGSPDTTSGQSGTVSKIWHFTHANTGLTDGTYNIKLGVYDDDYSNLMDSDVIHNVVADDQWVSEDYSFTLVDTTKYYMTVLWENTNTQTAYDTNSSFTDCYKVGDYSTGMTEPYAPAACSIDYLFSIYVEYAAAGGNTYTASGAVTPTGEIDRKLNMLRTLSGDL